MSRAAHTLKTKVIAGIVAVLIVAGGTSWGVIAHEHSQAVVKTTTSQGAVTQLTYHGQNGKTALALLKQHATITTKSSSYGVYVVSIDGNSGSGSKYWIFYVNGKEAQVGAGSYKTHNGDTITWKLEQ